MEASIARGAGASPDRRTGRSGGPPPASSVRDGDAVTAGPDRVVTRLGDEARDRARDARRGRGGNGRPRRAGGPPGATVRHLLAHASGCHSRARRRSRRPAGVGSTPTRAFGCSPSTLRTGRDAVRRLRPRRRRRPARYRPETTGHPGAGMHGSARRPARARPRAPGPDHRRAGDAGRGHHGAVPGTRRRRPRHRAAQPERLGARLRPARRKGPLLDGRPLLAAAFGHFGGTGTFLWVDPVAGMACAALTDREFGDWSLEAWPRLSDAVLDELAS